MTISTTIDINLLSDIFGKPNLFLEKIMTVESFVPNEAVESFISNANIVHMSKEAAGKVKEFMKEEDDKELFLRVFVQGGGCSGFQYGFTFEESLGDEDTVCNLHGLNVLIDSVSYSYLYGATIEYKESLAGARFSINNPNASTSCGCGESFSI